MPPKAARKAKIYRDNQNRRYLLRGRTKVYLPNDIGKNKLTQWIIQHFTKKRPRKPRAKKEANKESESSAKSQSDKLSDSKADARFDPDIDYKSYINTGAKATPTIVKGEFKYPFKDESPIEKFAKSFAENIQQKPKAVEYVKPEPVREKKGPEGREQKHPPAIEAPKNEEAVQKEKAEKKGRDVSAELMRLKLYDAIELLSQDEVSGTRNKYVQESLRKMLRQYTDYSVTNHEKVPRLLRLVLQYKDKIPGVNDDLRLAFAHINKRNQEGSGKELQHLGKNGLYGNEIENMMERAKPIFKGVIASDQIKDIPVQKKEPFAFVMNLDNSHQSGSHWVAIYCDPIHDKSLEYYDSFGRPCPPEFLKQIKTLVDKLGLNFYLKFKDNRVIDQRSNSSECGFFAMKFILDRLRGKPFKECTGYSNVTDSEKQIKKFEKEFGFI